MSSIPNLSKIYYIIIIHIQIFPMSSYWFIFVKIYYIWHIIYSKQIISWINTIRNPGNLVDFDNTFVYQN